ncbi:MAG: DUF6502 family protein [Thiolinea sp.]
MNKLLHQVILQILRPLIRILHRRGIAFGEFSQIARRLYVEAAEQELIQRQDKVTTSRIAISTGLTRKDVAQLRQAPPLSAVSTTRYNRAVRVISGWINDPEFQDHRQQPAVLPLQLADEQPDSSFATLVSRYSGDMPWRAMLNELQQSGMVSLDKHGQATLLADAYIPQGDEQEKLAILGQDVSLLVQTIEHNLQAEPGQLRFQRKVRYDNLPAVAVAHFRQLAREKGMALLVELNDWLARHDRDHNAAVDGPERMSAGVGVLF